MPTRQIHITRMRGGFITALTKLRNGAPFDFFGFLKDVGSDIQTVIDKAAPITSKVAAPIASAITGVQIPDLGKVSTGDPMALSQAKDSAAKILEKNKDLLSKLLDSGVATTKTGAGYKKIKPER